MGSFFSATDDRDDLNAIGFSGVVGKLKDKEPEVKIRFNYYKQKYEVKLQDIFHTPEDRVVDVPEEWLANVNTPNYAAGRGDYQGYQGGRKWDHLKQYQFSKANPDNTTASGERAGPNVRGLPYHSDPTSLGSIFGDDEGGLPPGFPSGAQGKLPLGPAGSRNVSRELIEKPCEKQLRDESSGEEIDENDPVGNYLSTLEDDQYAFLAIQYGGEVANAFSLISDCMTALSGKDELISEVICDLFQLMEDEKQVDMVRELYNTLPWKYQSQIAENGM